MISQKTTINISSVFQSGKHIPLYNLPNQKLRHPKGELALRAMEAGDQHPGAEAAPAKRRRRGVMGDLVHLCVYYFSNSSLSACK